MKRQRNFVMALLSVLLFGGWALASAQAAETRVALVIGNANYPSGALPKFLDQLQETREMAQWR